jgi:hypothetical protein
VDTPGHRGRDDLATAVSGEAGTAGAASATPLRPPRSSRPLCGAALHDATFVVSTGANGANSYVSHRTVVDDFGPPARIYRFRGYMIMVWNKNLLADLGAPR